MVTLLRKVNLVISTVVLGYIGWLILGGGFFDLPTDLVFSLLALMYLLMGIEDVRDRKEKFGYLYLLTSLVIFSMLFGDWLNII